MSPLAYNLQHLLAMLITHSGLANRTMRVRSGPLRGLRWTFFPRTSYWRGTHEPELHRFVAALPGLPGKTAWDLGAHYGFYSLMLARAVGPAGRVDAFEPNPTSFLKLQRHADLNSMPQLHLHQAAVGSEPGETDMFSYAGQDDTAAHLAYTGENTTRAPHSWRVQVLRLDEEVATGRMTAPAFIKMDVEGFGHHTIMGARECIGTARPLIVAALHSTEESEGIDHVLRPLGYVKTDLNGTPADYTAGLLDAVYQPS